MFNEFAVIDFETTGLSADYCRVIEVAAALVKWSADNSGGPTHQILIVEKCE